MIDDGETDWKVIAIAADDVYAEKLNDISDVETEIPGLINALREWFRIYKTAEGKERNQFALEERAENRVCFCCITIIKSLVMGLYQSFSFFLPILFAFLFIFFFFFLFIYIYLSGICSSYNC